VPITPENDAQSSPGEDAPPGHPPLVSADPGNDEADRPALAVRHALPLLASLIGDHLDPGYQAAAERRAAGVHHRALGPVRMGGRRSKIIGYLSVGLVVVGLVLGIAAASTKDQAANTNQTRTGLLHEIDDAQSKQSALGARETALAADIRSAQAALGVAGPLQQIRQLEALGGLTPVVGPGLTIVINGTALSPGAGVIVDRDIQLLVNGLWSAGAEAVAIGGVRLRATSSIRQAGGAILVDNRPVFWPMSIEAVGDPSSMHVKFVGTIGFGRFQTFGSLYGIRFDLTAQDSLTLPAGGSPDLQFASAVTTAAPAAAPLSGPVLPTTALRATTSASATASR